MKTIRILALVLALCMALGTLAGCASSTKPAQAGSSEPAQAGQPAASGSAAEGDQTLVILSSGAFQGAWDPTSNSILSNKHLEYNVLDYPLHYDAEGNITAGLCTAWEYQPDGYTLRLTVREGVKFHDGSDLTAEDVAASVEYMTRPESSRRADYGCQFKTNVVDEYTVDIWPENQTPLASLVTLLAHDPVLSSDDIANGTLNEQMNGCGPYKFIKYENETCFLERFEEYWDTENKAKEKYCEYKYVSEPATRLAALQTGDAHVIERVDIEQVPLIEADENIGYAKVSTDEQKYMIFKCTQGVMQSELLRKAISYAIDRETIVNDIMQGYAVLAESYVSHVSNIYAPADLPTFDLEKAAQYLAEAGYPNGEGLPPIKYITSTGFYPKTKEYAEYIVSTLAQIGIQVELVVEESAAWEAHLYEEDSCLMVDTGWMNMYGDGNAVVAVHYMSPGRCNFSSYPAVDEILKKESAITDPAARLECIENELYPALVETNTNMPLFDSIMVYGYAKNLEGLEFLPNSNINFASIDIVG